MLGIKISRPTFVIRLEPNLPLPRTVEGEKQADMDARISIWEVEKQVASGAGQSHGLPYLPRCCLGRAQAAATTYQTAPSRTPSYLMLMPYRFRELFLASLNGER